MPRDDGITMTWFVKVDGRVYGPYTPAQMRAFVSEGRIAAHSQVSENREQGWRAASDIQQFKLWLDEARRTPEETKPTPKKPAPAANFIVVAQLQTENHTGFEQSLRGHGDIEAVAPGVWLLRGATTAAHLRNELSHAIERTENLFIVDATRDRAAWFNLGQDIDQRIRSLWTRV